MITPKTSGIYSITNTVNGKIYIGSSVNMRRRVQAHIAALKRGKHTNLKLIRAWEKYGEAAFVVEIVEIVEDRQMLIVREQHWLDLHNSAVTGYNLRLKADGNDGIPHSEEHKAYISALYKGKPNGRLVTENTRQLISKANKGRKMPAEFSENLSNKLKGREITPEWRAKLSAARKGKPGPLKTEETRKKLSESLKGKTKSPEHRAKLAAATRAYFAAKKAANNS